jgi:hypothetical protein
VLQRIDEFLADPLSGKLVVFAHHRHLLDALAKHLDALQARARRADADSRGGMNGAGNSQAWQPRGSFDYIRIDGQTLAKQRHENVSRFQTDVSVRVALLSITAAGVALTLTAASTVFFAELYWTPGSLLQAEDRVHRIGQTATVKVHYLLAKNSIDEILWPLVRKKIQTLGHIFDGHEGVDFHLHDGTTTTNNKSGAPSGIAHSFKKAEVCVLSTDATALDLSDADADLLGSLEGIISEIAETEDGLLIKNTSKSIDSDSDGDNDDEQPNYQQNNNDNGFDDLDECIRAEDRRKRKHQGGHNLEKKRRNSFGQSSSSISLQHKHDSNKAADVLSLPSTATDTDTDSSIGAGSGDDSGDDLGVCGAVSPGRWAGASAGVTGGGVVSGVGSGRSGATGNAWVENEKMPCRFFAMGNCHRGSACSYLHSSDPRVMHGAAREPCVFFASGYCRNGSNCVFTHSTAALPALTPAQMDRSANMPPTIRCASAPVPPAVPAAPTPSTREVAPPAPLPPPLPPGVGVMNRTPGLQLPSSLTNTSGQGSPAWKVLNDNFRSEANPNPNAVQGRGSDASSFINSAAPTSKNNAHIPLFLHGIQALHGVGSNVSSGLASAFNGHGVPVTKPESCVRGRSDAAEDTSTSTSTTAQPRESRPSVSSTKIKEIVELD